MPYISKARFITTEDRDINFTYQCWFNHKGDGLVSVEGRTDEDHLYLIQHRAEVARGIKQAENLTTIRYFESQGNGRHTEIKFEGDDPDHDPSNPLLRDSLSNRELSEQGERLCDQAEEHKMNLAAHEFKPNPEITRALPGAATISWQG